MSNKRKGQTVACDEWAKHLRPDGRREFWKAQRQADKAIVASGDDASVRPKATGKRLRRYKPFVLRFRCNSDGRWRTWGSYETSAARDAALETMKGTILALQWEWRSIDRKA